MEDILPTGKYTDLTSDVPGDSETEYDHIGDLSPDPELVAQECIARTRRAPEYDGNEHGVRLRPFSANDPSHGSLQQKRARFEATQRPVMTTASEIIRQREEARLRVQQEAIEAYEQKIKAREQWAQENVERAQRAMGSNTAAERPFTGNPCVDA